MRWRYASPRDYCPYCGNRLKTVGAKRCGHCGADWHVVGAKFPDHSDAPPKQVQITAGLRKVDELQSQARLSYALIRKLGYTTGAAVVVIVSTLIASAVPLSLVGTSLFSGFQLTVLYIIIGLVLFAYAILTFTLLQHWGSDSIFSSGGILARSLLLRPLALEYRAALLKRSLIRRQTQPLSNASTSVSTPPRSPAKFDVFLSHNSEDKEIVRKIATSLESRGLRVWLDERHIKPGEPWQFTLEQTIESAPTAAIMVGQSGFGPWQVPEIWGCLCQLVERQMPLIPVLLPGAPKDVHLPLFLKVLSWIDLRGGITHHAMDLLEWGITGVHPESGQKGSRDDIAII